jgi:hypothetical protein
MALGLAALTCGRFSSSFDCTQRATCPDSDGPIGDDTSTDPGNDVTAEESHSEEDSHSDGDRGDATGEEVLTDVGRDADGESDEGSRADALDESALAEATGGDVANEAEREGGDGPACVGALSNVGAGDFRIAFSLQTSTSGAALLNQRSVCNHGALWDVRLNGSTAAALGVETDDNTRYTKLSTSTPVDDGVPHDIVIARAAGTLTVQVDGTLVGTAIGSAATTTLFGALPALQTGTDVCDGVDGTQPLAGTISNVCISH